MTKVFDEFPECFKEAYATFEFFRKLGFPPSSLFIHLNPDGIFFIVLQFMDKQFAVNIGHLSLTEDELVNKWTEMALRIANGEFDEQELQNAWQNSFVFNNKIDALMAMSSKGIRPPITMN